MDAIKGLFAGVDWKGLLANLTNDKIITFFTSPWGLGVLGAIILLSLVNKWRITFTVVCAALALSLVGRYTLAGPQTGPNKTLFLFAGGAVAVGAFLIYFLFIKDE